MKLRLTNYIKYITDDEFKIIGKWINKLESPAIKACLRTLAFTGIRVGECVELTRDNFNKDFSVVTFELKKSKRIKERILPSFLSKELVQYYKKYYWRMTDHHMFFANYKNQSKNKHIQRDSVGAKFKQLREELKLDQVYYVCKDGKKLYRISPHTMRHYAIYRFYKAAGNCIITAQQIIGHKKIETTAKYINALDSMNNEAQIIEKAFVF